jgi:hypothetical protein
VSAALGGIRLDELAQGEQKDACHEGKQTD